MTQPSKTPGAVLYTRVSTGDQDRNGTSPETQRDACRQKALALGLPIAAEYHDGGISGGLLTTRAGMQAALSDITEGRADTLICANLSRYSRDVGHQQAIKKAVRAAGGRLVFCDMTFEDTPEGDLNFTIQGGFAEYEKAVIRKRTMRGNRARAEQGLQPARLTSPYGYKVPTRADALAGAYAPDQIGRYLVVETEAVIVRQLFQMYASGGYSLYGLCKWLTSLGIPTPRGRRWHGSSVRYILTNPAYKGAALFGRWEHGTDERLLGQAHPHQDRLRVDPNFRRPAPAERQVVIPCPALVTEELWETVSARLAENKAGKSGNPERVLMLSGRAVCPLCGENMIVVGDFSRRRSARVRRYQCGGWRRVGGPTCPATTYPVDETEGALLAAILEACERPEAVRAAVEAYRKAPEAGADAEGARRELQALSHALDRLNAEQAATVQAQIAGIMAGAAPEAYAEVFAQIAARRKDLEDRRGQLSRSVGARRRPEGRREVDMGQVMSDVARTLTSPALSGAQKRDLLGGLVRRVVCQRGGARVVFAPGALGEDEETEQTVKTVFRKGGADSTAEAFAVGSGVSVITRGLPSGLLMASVVSDKVADAQAEKAALKPVSLVGTAVEVQEDKGLLTLAPKTKPRQTVAILDTTKIKVEKTDAMLHQITPGMRVSVRLGRQKDSDGHSIATSLSAYTLTPKPLRKKAAASAKKP